MRDAVICGPLWTTADRYGGVLKDLLILAALGPRIVDPDGEECVLAPASRGRRYIVNGALRTRRGISPLVRVTPPDLVDRLWKAPSMGR
jgi:hypothetical protein